jgi:hypothetical protein
MDFLESSLNDLYLNIVTGFPNSRFRENATHPIRITQLRWLPFLGMKTLYVQGLAQNENREYNPIILFKNVKYKLNEEPRTVTLMASNGQKYYLESLSLDQDVFVRCGCKDFYWRMHHYNKVDSCLYGRDRKKYESLNKKPPANPLEVSGMCKHIIKLAEAIRDANLLH